MMLAVVACIKLMHAMLHGQTVCYSIRALVDDSPKL